jgi:acyl-CoA synthetase (AMP-forming)/AMP-acid ligase II
MTDSQMNVAQFLLAGKDPERAALLFIHDQYSYGDLQRRVEQVGRAILALGGRKGDRIVLLGENSFFWVSAYLGVLRAGLVCVPLSDAITSNDMAFVLRNTEARAIFIEKNIAARRLPGRTVVRVVTDSQIDALAADQPSASPFPDVGADDLAALMFTSGSTGQPRGVMVSHGNIIANTESIIEYLRLREDDRILTVLPFHYCFGTSLLHTHLRVGGSLVVEPRFIYTETVLQRMIDTACTGFAGVPSHFQILLRNSTLRQKSFPHLRYVQQAGGHLPPPVIHELCAALPTTQVFIMYGQTEATARLSYLPPECLPARIGSIGRGIPGVVLRVLNDAGEDVRPGEVGEIVARGANVARGYWRAPQETAASFGDGELRTGDLAMVDSDGFIYVVDRAKDFLKCGGERVSCRRIEEELLAFDELLEAAVVPVPDQILGEAAKAFIVPRFKEHSGLEERLTAFLKARSPAQLVPKQFVVLPTLPKNSSGKVLKAKLRAPETS